MFMTTVQAKNPETGGFTQVIALADTRPEAKAEGFELQMQARRDGYSVVVACTVEELPPAAPIAGFAAGGH